MKIENDLRKDGITVIEPLDMLSVTLISKFVAEKLSSALPFYNLKYHNLFVRISRISMYIADIPDGLSEANYFYKNSSIYFKRGLSLEDMQKFAVHEFIHHIQELKDNKNILYRLGLCDFTGFKIYGMALNEAAVQLISSKALKTDSETVKYYGIEFNTISPNCYPMICNLVNQMSYITGEDTLFESTLYSNDKFKNSFIKLCGEKQFYKCQNNLDIISNTEEKILTINAKLQNENLSDRVIAKFAKQIYNYKKLITNTFIDTQNLIFTSYFTNSLNNIYSVQDIEDFRKKLYNYRDLLGTTENYFYFNDFYIDMMAKLDVKYEFITGNNYMVEYKPSFIQILLSKVKKLIGLGSLEYERENKKG